MAKKSVPKKSRAYDPISSDDEDANVVSALVEENGEARLVWNRRRERIHSFFCPQLRWARQRGS